VDELREARENIAVLRSRSLATGGRSPLRERAHKSQTSTATPTTGPLPPRCSGFGPSARAREKPRPPDGLLFGPRGHRRGPLPPEVEVVEVPYPPPAVEAISKNKMPTTQDPSKVVASQKKA
jgi:hypothetical protein